MSQVRQGGPYLIGSFKMSPDEFWSLPRIIGWKYEYFGGEGHITPRGCPVAAVLPLEYDEPASRSEVRPAEDIAGLAGLFVASFTGTVEYAEFTSEKMIERSQTSLQSHLAGRRGEPRPESCVFLHQDVAVGAALIVQKAHGPHLDMILVDPTHRRLGVAAALLREVSNALVQDGEKYLTSAYHLSNEPSRGWHRRMGFKEIPNEYAEQMRVNHLARQDISRGKKPRPTRQQLWLKELVQIYGREAALTLDTVLRPGKVGRVKCPEWLQEVLDYPQRLP